MSAVPTNVGVFFGQVDKRAEGRYWADAQSEKLRGTNPRAVRNGRGCASERSGSSKC
jgi:hypothetical protein